MKDSTETVCQRNSSETAQQNFVKLCSGEGQIPCRCAYSQDILIQLFMGVMPFFNLEIWPKLKILLTTVLQRNSTESAQHNIVKLFSYREHNVKICIFTVHADLIFLRSNLYPFWTLAKIILCNSDETCFLSDCPSLMLGIDIRCIQHSQAMLECGVCALAHSFFHYICNAFLAHLSWKLKWAFLITCRPSSVCPSVRPYVCPSVCL